MTYEQFQYQQQQISKPLTLGQNYLLASSGISKKKRAELTDADIRANEHLLKTENNQMTELQINYLKKHFNIEPVGTGWTYKTARKEIIKHLQQTDFDPKIKQYQEQWNTQAQLPQPTSYDYVKTIDFEDDGE